MPNTKLKRLSYYKDQLKKTGLINRGVFNNMLSEFNELETMYKLHQRMFTSFNSRQGYDELVIAVEALNNHLQTIKGSRVSLSDKHDRITEVIRILENAKVQMNMIASLHANTNIKEFAIIHSDPEHTVYEDISEDSITSILTSDDILLRAKDKEALKAILASFKDKHIDTDLSYINRWISHASDYKGMKGLLDGIKNGKIISYVEMGILLLEEDQRSLTGTIARLTTTPNTIETIVTPSLEEVNDSILTILHVFQTL